MGLPWCRRINRIVELLQLHPRSGGYDFGLILARVGVRQSRSGVGALEAGAEELERKMVCGGVDSLGAVRWAPSV